LDLEIANIVLVRFYFVRNKKFNKIFNDN